MQLAKSDWTLTLSNAAVSGNTTYSQALWSETALNFSKAEKCKVSCLYLIVFIYTCVLNNMENLVELVL